jgi:CSLREA domain-containing protein
MLSAVRSPSVVWPIRIGLAVLVLATRASAATFEVDSTADDVTASDGQCTLREAIINANTDKDTTAGDCPAGSGADVIELPAGIYVLAIPGIGENAAATGDLDITSSLTLRGAGAGSTVIDAAGIDGVIEVAGDGSTFVALERLTITGGSRGGLLAFSSVVSLVSVEVSDNEGGDDWAGGITSFVGTLRLRDSTVAGNRGSAGGIWIYAGDASIVNSTISGNLGACGCARGFGGGCVGAGAVRSDGITELRNATVATNECTDVGPLHEGVWSLFGDFDLSGTIVSNPATSNCYSGYNALSSGHNIDSDDSCGLYDPTDFRNLDPLLGPLRDNGGPTPTHALLRGSPAIDAIPAADCNYDGDGDPDTPAVPLASDQRGAVRPHGAGCDIGAYEVTSCADGRDNDGDGRVDFDGGAWLDGNGDGFVDAAFDPATPRVTAPDPQCAGDASKTEWTGACGLGAELALLLAVLGRRGRRGSPRRRVSRPLSQRRHVMRSARLVLLAGILGAAPRPVPAAVIIDSTLLPPIQPAEAHVIQTAVDLWASVLVDLDGNLDTDESLPVTFVTAPLPVDIAYAFAFSPSGGLPTGGIISYDDGRAWHFFVDPTPATSEEFHHTPAGGPDHYGVIDDPARFEDLDLLSVILHELGHILGFTEFYPPWDAATADGMALLDYGSGTVGLLGPQEGLSELNALSHLAHADAPYDLMLGATYFPGPSGPDPDCVRFLPPCGEESGGWGDRRLVSRLDLDILEGIYGYTVDRNALVAVPEPGTALLVVAGAALLARRRTSSGASASPTESIIARPARIACRASRKRRSRRP